MTSYQRQRQLPPITRVNVLDHGFVELIDLMGDDRSVARAARISYGRQEPNRTLDDDMKLTRYLYEHQHTSPFEMVELQFRAKMPIFVARQWVRHRTANINEMSMRYTDMTDKIEFYTPKEWRGLDPTNKQGSRELKDAHPNRIDAVNDAYAAMLNQAERSYHRLKELGVANEMARMVLPVSVYTEWVWKNDLHNVLHFLRLRTDEHAQWEMREYALAMVMLLRNALPRLMEVVWPGN